MKFELYTYEKMLLELLSASISATPLTNALFSSASAADWKSCYLLAGKQGVTALAWQGITQLPAELFPPLEIKLNWLLSVKNQEKTYQHHCETVIELAELYAQHGISTIQLKGVGFSHYYPHPTLREGGDIDIYTCATDSSAMSDEEAFNLANQLIKEKGLSIQWDGCKHTVFSYNHIPVENHKKLINVYELRMAQKLEPILKQYLQPKPVQLIEESKAILTPSDSFNLIFIPFHAVQHYSKGMNLHHLCDWACLLNRCGLNLPKEAQDSHFVRMINVFTAFTNRFLGTSIAVKYNPESLDRLFIEVMRTTYSKTYHTSNPVKRFYRRLRHAIRYRLLMKKILGESFLMICWRLIRRKLTSRS